MAALHSILIFGGTFDPVHNGHIKVAMAVQDHFQFERVIFLPCKIPVLKNKAKASAEQRVTMLRLALNEHPQYPFEIDERELQRNTPSYTVDTLEDYRRQMGAKVSINFLMGADSFASLPRWHNWQRILMLANLLVIERPGHARPDASIHGLPAGHLTNNARELKTMPHGLVSFFNAGQHDISSTAVRNRTNVKTHLPESVKNYIDKQGLYRN